ncbi:MAG: hypothetical protein J7L14_03565 [Candidatus Diapherotrites archaeon]|nr:hypothetical protein [Candidatus Diapherotrites archaeon]
MEFKKYLDEIVCDWCVFKACLEPTNRRNGWQILGVKISDGIYFAFEGKDDSLHTIHITCFCNLADKKARHQIVDRSKKWWLVTNTGIREYPSVESFKAHFPNLFEKRRDEKNES